MNASTDEFPAEDSTRQYNSLFSIAEIVFKPRKDRPCNTGSLQFMQRTIISNTVKCFADVTEDSSDLFSSIKCLIESVIEESKLAYR